MFLFSHKHWVMFVSETCWRCTSSSPLWCLVLFHSDIIEYSLTKVLEHLKISHEEVNKTSFLQHSLEYNIDQIKTDLTQGLSLPPWLLFFLSLPVCWPVHPVGMWLLRQDRRVGSEESPHTHPEAPDYWECSFECEQKGNRQTDAVFLWMPLPWTTKICTLSSDMSIFFLLDPSSTTFLEVRRSTEIVSWQSRQRPCRTDLEWARWGSTCWLPLPYETCQVCLGALCPPASSSQTAVTVFFLMRFQRDEGPSSNGEVSWDAGK